MKNIRAVLFIFAACAGLHAQCVPGGLAVVVPRNNPTDGLSMAQLRKLVLGDVHTWPDKSNVTLVATDPDSPVFKCLLSAVVRMSSQEYRKYIMSAEFRGDEPLRAKTVDSSPTAVKVVSGFTGAITVVEANSLAALAGSVKVLSINGKKPGEAGYPLP
jgi:ABC-type phosphate transport system substrate-binding protein